MAKKLALINPAMHSDLYSSNLLYSPLALAYVAAYTPNDWEITSYDEYVDEYVDPDKIDADLVAMSALTPNIPRAYYLADKLRQRGITTVCGGAHVSALPAEAVQFFDAVVLGEAEPIWPQVIADFESGNLQQVYDGGFDRSVEDIRLPRRDLIHKNYRYPSLITSKGCPFRCDYCYLSVYEKKKYRVLPVDAIIEDMEVINRQNHSIVVFGDENVSGYSAKDHENREELFERMIKKRFSFVLRWLFKDPSMVKFFLKVLSSNITPKARLLKKKQWEKEAFMRKLIEEHFRGTQLDESETIHKELSGTNV